MGDVRNYLLQYYTEAWVDYQLSREDSVFIEYNHRLYMHVGRAGFPFTNWETAIHTLLKQDGSQAMVQTTALNSPWHMFPNLVFGEDRKDFFREAQEQIIRGETYISTDILVKTMIEEVWYYFTLIDGRIDSIITPPDWNLFHQW